MKLGFQLVVTIWLCILTWFVVHPAISTYTFNAKEHYSAVGVINIPGHEYIKIPAYVKDSEMRSFQYMQYADKVLRGE